MITIRTVKRIPQEKSNVCLSVRMSPYLYETIKLNHLNFNKLALLLVDKWITNQVKIGHLILPDNKPRNKKEKEPGKFFPNSLKSCTPDAQGDQR